MIALLMGAVALLVWAHVVALCIGAAGWAVAAMWEACDWLSAKVRAHV